MKPLPFLPDFPVMLAPMAGYTDATYRALCHEQGCDFTFTEMISAKGLKYGGKSGELMETDPSERPCGIQLFGREPDIMAEVTRRICGENRGELGCIDINMGCPAPKITGNGEGSALMKEPCLAGRIIEAVVSASDLPVSVKFRKGWDGEHVNCLEFAKTAESAGAAFITVHGRTRDQMYSGKADWDAIAEVKQAVSLPVIGNGDIFSAADAISIRRLTRCDGIMIARGAIGNPFIFAEVKAAFSKSSFSAPSPGDRLDMAVRHINGLVQRKGPHAVVEMRKHIAAYVNGMRDASAFRVAATQAPTAEALTELIYSFKKEQEQ